MSTIVQPAGGASAYSRPTPPTFRPLDSQGIYGPDAPRPSALAWSRAIDELLRIRTFEDDWDGEGSEAPHPALVDGALGLARALQTDAVAPPDRVHAGVNATVYFEWHTPFGYTEIEVVSPVEAECRTVRPGSDTTDVVTLSLRS